ncbi:T9SS type A sorting domain-containing protein [candidate division KSB1 bacterium]|nr:T9SS type A sorting domain-containing protein [candidate division KSB1 bacterium]
MMKNFFQVCSLVLLGFILVFESSNALANVYASQIKVSNPDGSAFDGKFSDGTGARISFFLNDDASAVNVRIKDTENGSIAAEIVAGAMSRGLHSVTWDGTGAEAGKRYVIEITAEQPNKSNTDWTLFYDSGDINIFTRGVAVVTDQTDPNFGLIFTANDGGPLGTGIAIYNPDGGFHNPFLVAADITSSGTIDYGTDAPLFTILDQQGRLYVTLKDKGQVMRINRDFSTDVIIDGLSFPKGIYVKGEGEDFTIYVASNRTILRGKIGTANSLSPSAMDTLAVFSGFFPHQIILDDEGFLYTTLRQDNALGSDGMGIRKYDISGTLPVTDDDAQWFLGAEKTFIANDLLLDRGADKNSAVDDILYYVTRAGENFDQDGIWRIDDINSFFADTVRIMTENTFYRDDINVQARATIDFDAAGNIVFMENANEHIFFLSPPGQGPTNSFTSTSAETLTVSPSVRVEDRAGTAVPVSYRLEQNYPNPFNPSTTISYALAKPGVTVLKIYDVLGKEVRLLLDEYQATGEHTVQWDGKDHSGRSVVSGVYIVTIESGTFRASRRMTLAK